MFSVTAILALSGCSSLKEKWEVDRPLKMPGQQVVTVYDEAPRTKKITTEANIINPNAARPSPYDIKKTDVIVEDVHASTIPPRELMQYVSPTDFYGKRIGDIFKVLTNTLQETSLIYEPNVNAGLVINMRVGKMKLYDLMKTIAESVGYYVYYDSSRHAVVVSQMKEMRYYIPAGIFVDRKVDVALGNAKGDAGGGSSGGIDLNANNPVNALKEALDNLGSKDKIYSFDKDAGILVLKEHAIFIPQITEFVYDFVKDRSRKFIVEMAIVDVNVDQSRERTFDLSNIMSQLGYWAAGASLGSNGMVFSPSFNDTGTKAATNGFSIGAVISLINQNSSTEVVDQAKSVVANHSVKYLGNMTTSQLTTGVSETESGSNSNRYTYQFDKEDVKNGVQFTARIDGYSRKDYIDVTIAPTLAYGQGQLDYTYKTANGGDIPIYSKVQQVREMLSTASIRSGDIIITGGLIRDAQTRNAKGDPITEDTFLEMGTKSNKKQKVETLFIVKVTELTDPSQTFNFTSSAPAARNLAEDKIQR